MADKSCPHKEMQMPHQRQVATEWQMANVAHTPRVASATSFHSSLNIHTHSACANGCVCLETQSSSSFPSHSMYLCRSPCPTSSTLLLSTSCGVTMTLVCHAPAHGSEEATVGGLRKGSPTATDNTCLPTTSDNNISNLFTIAMAKCWSSYANA